MIVQFRNEFSLSVLEEDGSLEVCVWFTAPATSDGQITFTTNFGTATINGTYVN